MLYLSRIFVQIMGLNIDFFMSKKVEKFAIYYGGKWVVELGNVLLGIISKARAEGAPRVPIHKCGHKLLLKGLDWNSLKEPHQL